jgi:hypothetical protein
MSALSLFHVQTYVFQITSGFVRINGISFPSEIPNLLLRFVPSTPFSDPSSSVMTCVEAPQSSPLSWITKIAEKGIWEKSSFYSISPLFIVD